MIHSATEVLHEYEGDAGWWTEAAVGEGDICDGNILRQWLLVSCHHWVFRSEMIK